MNARHDIEHTSITSSSRRPILWVSILAALLTSIMTYSLVTGSRLARKYAPLQDAAMEIKLEAALAHLCLEEIVNSDRFSDISTVWEHLDRSAWYARTMLEGGENSAGSITPLRDRALRHEIEEVLTKLGAFRKIIEERWATQTDSGIRRAGDQPFEMAYEDLFNQIDGVETTLQVAMANDLFRFKMLQGFLIVLSLVLFAAMALAIRYYIHRQFLSLSAVQENEAWLRLSMKTAGVAFWEYDLVKNQMARSQNHDQLYGMKPQECWSIDTFMNAVHPDDRAFASGLIEESIMAGGPNHYNFDYRTIWPDKSVHWLSLTGEITERNSEGNASQMKGCLMDVTERKNAEENLKASEERFRLIYENAPVLIDSFDENGKCVLWNKRCQETFGWTIEEINAHDDSLELFYPDPVIRAKVTKTITQEPDGQFREWHPVTKDGRVLSIIWANFRISSGLIFSLGHDITERKQEQAQLLLMNDALENSLNAFDIVNAKGEITYANNSYVKLWGYDRAEEIIGLSVVEHCQDPALPEKIIHTLQTIGKFEGELTAKRKDGSTFEVLIYARAAQDSEGQPVFPTTFIDITALKQAQQDVLKERNRLQFAMEVSHTGAWDLDLIDFSSHRTPGHDHIFGYDKPLPEWTYEIFLAHVVPEEREDIAHRFEDALIHQSDWDFECRIRWPDGQIRWIRAVGRHGTPVDGTVQFMGGVVQDITERKQTETELQRAHDMLETRVKERTAELEVRRNEAEALNRAMINVLGDLKETNLGLETAKDALRTTNKELEAFSYSVSHDLRAPLRHIDGFVRLLLKREKDLNPTSARYLDTIANASGRMGRLIDDLLAFSRTNRSKMRTESIDLNEVVQLTIKDLSTLTEGRRITWEIGDLPLAQADGSLIRQVWENLIGNAIKYTGYREQARIEIGTTREGSNHADELVFFIRDNGAGFDPQYVDKLFGVFQRLHREDEFEGTGIGLATVGRIIHRHGGRVWAEGAVNQGATFYFTLKEAKGSG
jgi:PAS domain S-box-containing protein